MSTSRSPEPSYRGMLHDIAAQQAENQRALTTLVFHNENGADNKLQLMECWQTLPGEGREGVRIYHIPHPDRPGVLHATMFIVNPASHYQGSMLDESRLIGIVEGAITLNGVPFTPGQFVWLPPGQPTSWSTEVGATGIVQYNVPPPDLDLSEFNLVPLKPQ